MAVQVSTDNTVITVTPLAIEKIKALLVEKAMPADTGLRVFVAGGGCSGMQYGMAFEPHAREDDTTTDAEGVRIVIDPISLDYLRGANIDYVETLAGGGFTVENPNAAPSCGCGGDSFRSDEEAGHSHSHEGGGCGCGCH